MKTLQWKDGETVANFLYYNETGRIVGEVGRAGHQINTKHFATIFQPDNNIINLGMYINTESAKGAVEHYFIMQSRTLVEYTSE